jgi:hypothetical protein
LGWIMVSIAGVVRLGTRTLQPGLGDKPWCTWLSHSVEAIKTAEV